MDAFDSDTCRNLWRHLWNEGRELELGLHRALETDLIENNDSSDLNDFIVTTLIAMPTSANNKNDDKLFSNCYRQRERERAREVLHKI